MTGNLQFIILWWFLFFIVGVGSIPLCWLFFRRFIDLGYGFAKTVGLLTITFIAFLLSIFHVAPLTNISLYLIAAVYFLANTYIYRKNKQKIGSQIRKSLKILVTQEILFTSGLFFWSIVRGYQPEIRGLEKFMDIGFINSILKTRFLPPTDMWFSGQPINYYWFGHLNVAVATKLSNISSSVTYNLMLATILGMTLVAAFSMVTTLIKKLGTGQSQRAAVAAGIISAILLVFAGNFHTPIYALKEGPKNYWYPDATRFIGYHPEKQDKTIHEFPIYSFVVSDLHAHLINLPFVLLYIALLMNYVLNSYPKFGTEAKLLNSKHEARSTKQYLNFNSQNSRQFKKFEFKILNLIGNSQNKASLIPLGFILGIMFMTSTWDFGNYLLVSSVTFLLFNIKNKGLNIKALWTTGVSLIIIFVLGLLTSLPFLFNFTPLAQGIKLVNSRTPLWQLGVLWGFPAILTAVFVSLLYKFRPKTRVSDLFVFSLLTSSWILIAIPEIVYVKDIYVASHHRANTMFKLTYQAYVMFYLSSGYIAVRTLRLIQKTQVKILLLAFYGLVFGSILIYPSFAIKSYYGELKTYRGLSGDSWLKDEYPGEYSVISWFKENVEGQPVILEAHGDSYTDFNVISAYTGFPTVSGWFVHEWLWRGDASFPQGRVNNIVEIYTSSDVNKTESLLDKYNVEYVIIGTLERQKYPNLQEQKFDNLGNLVFSSGNTRVYQLKQ